MNVTKNSTRLSQLLQWLAESPNDPFLLYALATEYLPIDTSQSLFYYEKLLSEHPSYTATYYHLAALYVALEQMENARTTYQKGIEVCEKQAERHNLMELRRAYQEFEQEMTD